jgi:hypothetical protein
MRIGGVRCLRALGRWRLRSFWSFGRLKSATARRTNGDQQVPDVTGAKLVRTIGGTRPAGKPQPFAPGRGKGRLRVVECCAEPVRRQPRRNYRARNRPHPRSIGRRAAAAKDATDGTGVVQHVVIVRGARAGAAVASAAKGKRL